MPCRDDYGDRENEREYRERLDKTTDMLCWICGSLKNTDWLRKDIQEWWAKHQEADQAREARELKEQTELREKNHALNQLTPFQRRILNLPDPSPLTDHQKHLLIRE